MTTDEGIKYDRSLLGVEHPIGTFSVTREMVVGFARWRFPLAGMIHATGLRKRSGLFFCVF